MYETYKEEKREFKKCLYPSKNEVNEHFQRKVIQYVCENGKLSWKEVSKVNGGKVEGWSRIKDGDIRLTVGEDEVQRIWKDYFEDLYTKDTQEEVGSEMKSNSLTFIAKT